MPGLERPLRVGVMIDGFTVPAWIAFLVRDVLSSEHAQIVLVIRNATPSVPRSRFSRLFKEPATLLYRAYTWFDQWFFRANIDAFFPTDLSGDLSHIPCHDVVPLQTRFVDRFSPSDLEIVQRADLDVILRFGFRILKGEILTTPRYGVWSHHHGDNRVKRGMPPGFWEVMEEQPLTGSILQRLTEDLDNGDVLYRSWSHTDPISVHRGKNALYWKTSRFVPRVLAALHRTGDLHACEPTAGAEWYSGRMYTTPHNLEMFGCLSRHLWRVLVYLFAKAFTKRRWHLYERQVGEGLPTSLWRYRRIPMPSGSFLADPFLFEHEGKTYLFLEEYDLRLKKGRIAYVEAQPDGTWSSSKVVLDLPYHLSHPFIFSWENSVYLIPESAQNHSVDVYRATLFPDKWERVASWPFPADTVDVTLHHDGNYWWLFANQAERKGASTWDELFLYYAETPLGPWTPHGQNPIVSDVRRARPAGSLFEREGVWYRPAQDGSLGYGSALRLQRITKLTPEAYQETDGPKIEPSWEPGLTGVHTITIGKDRVVVDGLLDD